MVGRCSCFSEDFLESSDNGTSVSTYRVTQVNIKRKKVKHIIFCLPMTIVCCDFVADGNKTCSDVGFSVRNILLFKKNESIV